jgi:hypothetical protein
VLLPARRRTVPQALFGLVSLPALVN